MIAALALLSVLLAFVAGLALLRARTLVRAARQEAAARAAAAKRELYCPLTGLANRRRATDWLTTALAEADDGSPAAIAVSLDPEHYDEVAQAGLAGPIAARIARLAGDRALAARLGPGEYLVGFSGAVDGSSLIARAQAIGEALTALLGNNPHLRIGAALPGAGDNAEALIGRAEEAMASGGRDSDPSIGLLGPDLEQALRSRAEEVRALAAAIADGHIEPFFQPLVELGSGKVLGFEVLARWRAEGGHVRLPAEFVPLAEESGLISEMFFALLRKASAQVRGWPPEWSYTLNLSPLQFADGWLVERTVQTLMKSGVAPGRLELEISERALEHDFDGAKRTIEALRRVGIRIALDNFGSGRLPLRDLARLQFDRLKVDGTMLGADSEAGRQVALGVIAAAAHQLGVPVIAQGIETSDGAATAQSLGCEIGQGFLFGRPDPQTEYFRLDGSLARGERKAS